MTGQSGCDNSVGGGTGLGIPRPGHAILFCHRRQWAWPTDLSPQGAALLLWSQVWSGSYLTALLWDGKG